MKTTAGRVRSVGVSAALAVAALLVASSSRATPNFPPRIQKDLSLSSAPDCSLCHVGEPGLGTVRTGFGVAMLARGLAPFQVAALDAALQQMTSEAVDTDGDCVTDVEELEHGTDPNVAGVNATCSSTDGGAGAGAGAGGGGGNGAPVTSADSGPRYGCGAHIAPVGPERSSPAAAAVVVVAGALAVFARLRRRC